MCRAPIPRPHGALMIRIARIMFSKFANGSPIPMNTMLSILREHGVAATLRREKGHDIDAACGQLRLQTKRELETASS